MSGISAASKNIYHVARLDKNENATFAFNLRRKEDGGIGLSSIKEGLTSVERTAVLTHFGTPITVRTGGADGEQLWEGTVTHEPGTQDHFVAAVHQLPDPFCLVASED